LHMKSPDMPEIFL